MVNVSVHCVFGIAEATQNQLVLFQMKLPASVGQKKAKAIDQVLEELGIGNFYINFNPRSTELFCMNLGDQWVLFNLQSFGQLFLIHLMPMLRVYGHYKYFDSYSAGLTLVVRI